MSDSGWMTLKTRAMALFYMRDDKKLNLMEVRVLNLI